MADYRECPFCKYINPSTYYSCGGCAKALDPRQAHRFRKASSSDIRDPKERGNQVDFWLTLTLLLFVVGLFIIPDRWHDIKGSCLIDTTRLERTQGVINESQIIRKKGKRGSSCHYDIWYSFKVDNTVYNSNEITFSGTGTRNKSFANGYVSRYPVGKAVDVYYEKSNPSFSVLEPDVKDPSLWGILAVQVGLGVAVVVLIWVKMVQKQQEVQLRTEFESQSPRS